MKLTIKYDGVTYIGKETAGSDHEFDKHVQLITDAISHARYFKLELESGDVLLLSGEAIGKCVLIFMR